MQQEKKGPIYTYDYLRVFYNKPLDKVPGSVAWKIQSGWYKLQGKPFIDKCHWGSTD